MGVAKKAKWLLSEVEGAVKTLPRGTSTHIHLYYRGRHTLSLSPAVCVSLCLSEPARSTRFSRLLLILAIDSLVSCTPRKAGEGGGGSEGKREEIRGRERGSDRKGRGGRERGCNRK